MFRELGLQHYTVLLDLDGEIVALDEQGHSRFEWLVNRGKQQGTLFQELSSLGSIPALFHDARL